MAGVSATRRRLDRTRTTRASRHVSSFQITCTSGLVKFRQYRASAVSRSCTRGNRFTVSLLYDEAILSSPELFVGKSRVETGCPSARSTVSFRGGSIQP